MSKLAWVLVVVGALNWGLVGVGMLAGGSNLNVVNLIFGGLPWLEAIIYLLVALSAIMLMFSSCGCGSKSKKSEPMQGGMGGDSSM